MHKWNPLIHTEYRLGQANMISSALIPRMFVVGFIRCQITRKHVGIDANHITRYLHCQITPMCVGVDTISLSNIHVWHSCGHHLSRQVTFAWTTQWLVNQSKWRKHMIKQKQHIQVSPIWSSTYKRLEYIEERIRLGDWEIRIKRSNFSYT